MAFTIGRAFGSGMGLGKICGAVSGAFMVLGFKHQNEGDERQARYKTYELVKEFIKRYEEKHGTTSCKDLLGGVDLSTDKGRQEAIDRKLFTAVCPAFVKDAAKILDDLLK
jgi:C_GCAxxG_C_C family probable redox protein